MKTNEIAKVTTVEQAMTAQCMTSIEIAAIIGKPHNDLLKAIRKMEPAWQTEHQGNFSQMQIKEQLPNGGYRMRPCYMLTKTESLFVATKFNDVARARLVLRWEQLEKENYQRHTAEPQKLLVTEAEIMSRSDEIRRHQIGLENQDADGCFTTSEIAKQLDITVKELNRLLVEEGVQYYNGGRYKLNQKYADSGLAQDRSFHYYALDGEKKQRFYLVWTVLGAEFIKNLV